MLFCKENIGIKFAKNLAALVPRLKKVKLQFISPLAALFTNTAAPLLVPLSAPNPSSLVRKHGYELFLRNSLQTKTHRNHHSDS